MRLSSALKPMVARERSAMLATRTGGRHDATIVFDRTLDRFFAWRYLENRTRLLLRPAFSVRACALRCLMQRISGNASHAPPPPPRDISRSFRPSVSQSATAFRAKSQLRVGGMRARFLIFAAEGYLMSMPSSKSRALETTQEHCRCADRDQFFCAEAWAGIADRLRLSERQLDIARCIMAGQEERQIARRLDVSFHTVQTHMKRLHEKLAVQSRVELVIRFFSAYRAWRSELSPPGGCPAKTGLAPL